MYVDLINEEKSETLEKIILFLKNYQFNPELIIVDLGKAGLNAIAKAFPYTRIFPCYFHMIRRFCMHVKSLNLLTLY